MTYLNYTDVVDCILQSQLNEKTKVTVLTTISKLDTWYPEPNEVMVEYEVQTERINRKDEKNI